MGNGFFLMFLLVDSYIYDKQRKRKRERRKKQGMMNIKKKYTHNKYDFVFLARGMSLLFEVFV